MIDGIHAWHFNKFRDNRTVLFCHGNSGNISHRSYIITMCLREKLNVLVFDYSGFGKSENSPSQEIICQNGIRMYDYLVNEKSIDKNKIVVWGESIGGAVATYIAAKRECGTLVLLSTFSSLDDVLLDYDTSMAIKFFVSTIKNYVRTLPNKEWITKIKCPIVIIHSDEDTTIPFCNSERLYSLISHDKKEFIKIKGSHSLPDFSIENLQKLFRFCEASCEHTSKKHCKNSKNILDKMLQQVNKYLTQAYVIDMGT
jgi:pimeloyl-ACP methyl ester carboxylesterase